MEYNTYKGNNFNQKKYSTNGYSPKGYETLETLKGSYGHLKTNTLSFPEIKLG